MISNDSISGQKGPGLMAGIASYFRGVRSEWGKITWPERRQVVAETIFVIVIVFVFTVSVYLVDLVLTGVFDLIEKVLGKV